MKPNLFLFLIVALHCINAVGQCPPSSMKIQSQACDEPKYLSAKVINCDTLALKWQGAQSQAYIITVSTVDTSNHQISKQDINQYHCGANGTCLVSIPVRQGSTVNWSVVAVCKITNTVFYSNAIVGNEVKVPYCYLSVDRSVESKINLSGLSVYPNPASDYLNVDYRSKMTGNVNLSVIDVTGKTVFEQSFAAKQNRNQYILNVHQFLPGVYVLSISSGQEISHAKFTILSK